MYLNGDGVCVAYLSLYLSLSLSLSSLPLSLPSLPRLPRIIYMIGEYSESPGGGRQMSAEARTEEVRHTSSIVQS